MEKTSPPTESDSRPRVPFGFQGAASAYAGTSPSLLPGVASFLRTEPEHIRWTAPGGAWRDEYQRRLISAEEAARKIESGSKLWLSAWQNPESILLALVARASELRDVQLEGIPITDYWFYPELRDVFQIRVIQAVEVTRGPIAENAAEFVPWWVYLAHKAADEGRPGARPIDVALFSVSPPNEHGYCNFGHALWDAKDRARKARTAIAEINDQIPETVGDTWIHVSEIDWFVEHSHLPVFFDYPDPEPTERKIAEHVAGLLKDGDALQIGTGNATAALTKTDILRNFKDLGFFSEMTLPGVIQLVQDGVITSERVAPNPGVAITTALGHGPADLEIINNNPRFAVMPVSYVHNPRVISSIDNMVSVNCAMSIDLTGQIAAGALGGRVWSGTGGQLAFALGALMSSGGRYVCVMPATAGDGSISRITPQFQAGQLITVPRELADIVVTEYGVANLLNKSERERARELISVAHPEHRKALQQAAGEMYGA